MSRRNQSFIHPTSISKFIVGWFSLLISLYLFVTTVQADIIKEFYESGIGRECEGQICHDFPLFGKVSYIDTNPLVDNIIISSSVLSLVLNIGSMGPIVSPSDDYQPGSSIPFKTLVVPYNPPPSRPDLGPNLTIYEIGTGITVDLKAYSNFDLDLVGNVLRAEEWNITTSGTFTWESGHGETISGPIFTWYIPEPATIYLLGIGLAGFLAHRYIRFVQSAEIRRLG